jgi:hypothetical protein
LISEASPSRAAAIQFIVCLGLVSLFADITYEGARSITGPFLRNLGSRAAEVGFVVGLGECLGFGLRLASGLLADRTRAYWTIAILGYLVNLVAVPMLVFAGSWSAAAALIIAERWFRPTTSPISESPPGSAALFCRARVARRAHLR